jgi:predicted DNA-binding antitoxin AbrB/MazE fold protein
MTKTIDVVFDGEVLRPEGPVDLKPHARYRITLEEAPPRAAGETSAAGCAPPTG